MCIQPQHMYPGAQPGVVLMQTDAGVVPQGYPAMGQQPVYIAQQVTIELIELMYWFMIQSKDKQKSLK